MIVGEDFSHYLDIRSKLDFPLSNRVTLHPEVRLNSHIRLEGTELKATQFLLQPDL